VRRIQRSLDDRASCSPNRNATFQVKTSLAKSNCSLKAGHVARRIPTRGKWTPSLTFEPGRRGSVQWPDRESQVTTLRTANRRSRKHSVVMTFEIRSTESKTSTKRKYNGVKPKRQISGARKSPMTPFSIRAWDDAVPLGMAKRHLTATFRVFERRDDLKDTGKAFFD